MNTDFRSDNTLGCSPEIIEALSRASKGPLSPYGNDEITARVKEKCREIFETDLEIFPVLTGTAGNCLSIASMTPPWGAVFCHAEAHVERDELGAPEFFTEGAKLIPIPGANGKMTSADLDRMIDDVGNSRRMAIPSCLSLTQATESGTVYRVDELKALCDVAHRKGLKVHMDGARFSNALVKLGCSPAEATWRAGVDILVFGATKGGALGAEVIVVFRKELAPELALRFHRSGHRLSKMRLLSAQLEAYLSNDLWLRNARIANETAAHIAHEVSEIEGVEVLNPEDANILIVRIDAPIAAHLRERGFLFYEWPLLGPNTYRLVTGFTTTMDDAEHLVNAMRTASGM